MRKERIGLESGHSGVPYRNQVRERKGHQVSNREGGDGRKHERVPFPRGFAHQPCGDSFDAICNRIALLHEVSDVEVSTSRNVCRRYVHVG